jgi:hypothetical protein
MKIHKPYFLRGVQHWTLVRCPRCGRGGPWGPPWGQYAPTDGPGFGVMCNGCALRLHCDSMSVVIKVHKS